MSYNLSFLVLPNWPGGIGFCIQPSGWQCTEFGFRSKAAPGEIIKLWAIYFHFSKKNVILCLIDILSLPPLMLS